VCFGVYCPQRDTHPDSYWNSFANTNTHWYLYSHTHRDVDTNANPNPWSNGNTNTDFHSWANRYADANIYS
jgi:hypothetical protein